MNDQFNVDTLQFGLTSQTQYISRLVYFVQPLQAFSVAEKELGIPLFLDVEEDMVGQEIPDRGNISAYVVQYFNCFKNAQPALSMQNGTTVPPAQDRNPWPDKGEKFLQNFISVKDGTEESTETRQILKNARRLLYYGMMAEKKGNKTTLYT